MEAKLAETTPKRPLAVTIGAAVATLVIIAGVLTGPTLLSCSGSPEGFGACVSGKLSDVGILPKPAPVAVAETTAPATTPEPAAQTATPETTQPAATYPDIITPTFGLLRAEPNGSVVIAGSGKPGTEVEVFSNDASIGKTKVETSGDWVLVPEKPLPGGGVELTVGEAGSKERSGQSFVVVIDPSHKNEPLVVASVPGKASEVLQGLAKPSTEQPMQVATAEEPKTATPASDANAPATATETPAAAPAAEQPAASTAQAPANNTTNTAAPAQSNPAATTATEAQNAPAAAPAATPAEPATPAATETAAAEQPAQPQVPATQPAANGDEQQVAAAEAPAATPATPSEQAPAQLLAPPTIDAIEIDGTHNFFAGAGPDGATVRLYVDDKFVADSIVRGGRWLVETTQNVLTKSAQLVRVDLLRPGTSEVAARAEVNFEVQLPGAEAPVAVAQAEAPAATPPAAAPATPSTTEAPATATAPTEQSANTPASISETPAPAQATEAAAQPQAPVAPTQSNVPTMVAVPVGNDPEAQRFASGKAIIRSGDNLWTIARRVYGQGIKYTTIYEANTTQIRDPHWIYPGQVFSLPEDKQ
ncbi:LysM peptidoglycan-binding domain-containing protein [Devosia sp. D6-9]|nr:LysM peptidoglycan-binding domain-containing protein [Devosia sp. D6-9]